MESFCSKKTASQPPWKSTKKPGINASQALLEKAEHKRQSKTPDVKNSMRKNVIKASGKKELSPIYEPEQPSMHTSKSPLNILSAKRDAKKSEILLKNQNSVIQSKPKGSDVVMEEDVVSSDTENKELNELMSKMIIDHQNSHSKVLHSQGGDVEMVDEFAPEDWIQPPEQNEEDWEDIEQNSVSKTEDKENRETNKMLKECIKRLTEAGEALLSKEKPKSGKSEHPCLKSSLRPNTSLHDHLDTHKKSVTIITPNRAGVLQLTQ